ncbi:MAG: hypothetical protein ACSHXW_13430 [Yoonia sp.]
MTPDKVKRLDERRAGLWQYLNVRLAKARSLSSDIKVLFDATEIG